MIENLTAVLSFSASLLLFVTGRMERKALRRWIYVLGGTVLLFIAGEEISWGQRIFGYPTPDWIAERNAQEEFNLHNLHIFHTLSYLGFMYGVQLLFMMSCVAFFTGRKRILGIPVPSILLTLGLLAIQSYDWDGTGLDFISFALRILSEKHSMLICLIIIFALFCRQYELLIFSAAAVLFFLALAVVNYLEILQGRDTSRAEGFEYLITLGIFCYSLDLFLSQRHSSNRSFRFGGRSSICRSIGPFFRRLAILVGQQFSRVLGYPSARESGRPLWPTLPALLISISIGLVYSAYVDFRSKETYARNLDQAIASREPILRSDFNVYFLKNRIIYYKESCLRNDIEPSFFLHMIPTDLNESSIFRRFTFPEQGTGLYESRDMERTQPVCLVAQSLPRWEIAGIGTGQESTWRAFTPTSTNAFRRMYNAVVSREPRVRSAFDIYLHDRTLIFVKDPCLRSDVEAIFFLHVEPVDNASLPSHRQEHRFDGLDFRFSDFGTVFGDKCIAFVPLPTYDMNRIASGQYTSEKRLWRVEFPYPFR